MTMKLTHIWAATAVFILTLITGSFFVVQTTAHSITKRPEGLPIRLQTTRSDASGLQFTLHTSPFEVKDDGEVSIAGLTTRFTDPGAPALPYYATYIALPPEAVVSVQVQAAGIHQRSLDNVPPAPDMLFLQAEGVGVSERPRQVYHQDAAIYGRNTLYPDTLFTVSEPMYYRDIRLVSLQLFPLRYNPVSGQAWQAQTLTVNITFNGGQFDELRPSPHANDKGLSHLILNNDVARPWRSLPANVRHARTTALPIGVDTYKITVNEDGIYDICQAELAAAGMNVGSVNPYTIEMLYRGEPLSYQFIGDADTSFEPGECVRFYGWKFVGPRQEMQFVTDNVYWLWANGTASTIATAPNELAGNVKTSVWYTQTAEPELDFFSTWTDQWATFDNEPDAFYWDRIARTTTSGSYNITLADPDPTAATAAYLAEFSSAAQNPNYANKAFTVTVAFNSAPNPAARTWYGRRNVNVSTTLPASYLIDGSNTVAMTFNLNDRIYLNRISVFYMRQLITENDQFILVDEVGGNPLQVSGYTSANALVWNITDPLNPTAVDMSTGVSGSGPYSYSFGLNHLAGTKFIATTTQNIKQEVSISQYVPPSLNPADNAAEWLLITHVSLLSEATQLAAHRADPTFGGLDTHLVNIQDIINEYGYGLPLPAAVRDYLTYALGNWTVAPSYVMMFGDATLNPRQLPCSQSCSVGWDLNAPHLVLTDLPFVDRYQGLVPSDHTFVLLAGDDPLPDMAIGRMAVEDSTQASNAVRKTIAYESNPYTPPANPPFLFIADDDDPDAGYFCNENILTAGHIPAPFVKTQMCLGTAAYPDTDTLRNAMFPAISAGAQVVNYRGHGSIVRWAGGGDPIMTTADTVYWNNDYKPTLVLSADCLDGHFAWPGYPSIAETLLRYDFQDRENGSAGMWSSSGLGLTSEHTVLHVGFYDGLFLANGQTIGNATSYSKLHYWQSGNHESELYTFTLEGDPAMTLYWAPEPLPTPTPSNTPTPGPSPTPTVNHPAYLPVIQKP